MYPQNRDDTRALRKVMRCLLSDNSRTAVPGFTTHIVLFIPRLSLPSALLFALIMPGCVQEMANQPRFEAYEATALFAEGTSARTLPEGVVPRSGVRDGDTTAFDPPYSTGSAESRPLVELPLRVREQFDLPELLARGQARFAIYCVPCHGLAGDGDGMVPRRGFPYPPSYHTDRLRAYPVGRIFAVIDEGYGRMQGYGAMIAPADRWAIAAYVRSLQLSRAMPLDRLSDVDRDRLMEVTP